MEIEVAFCNNCLKKGNYSIPICEINEELNEIEYKCMCEPKKNNIEIIKLILNENIKKILNYCENHSENRYIAWCNKCKKNLCFLCISQQKHDYILYCHYYPSSNIDIIVKDFLKELLYIRIDYNYYNLTNQLNKINEIINHFELFYKLLREDDIINYQILMNFVYHISNIQKYIYTLKIILGKQLKLQYGMINCIEGYDNINNTKIIPVKEMNYEEENIQIITLFDEEKLNNNKILEKEENKWLYIIYHKFKYTLKFYDKYDNLINEISHNDYIWDICDIILIKSNLLLLQRKEKFYFLYFSPNFLNYEFSNIFIFDSDFKVSKINNNYMGIFSEGFLYYVK